MENIKDLFLDHNGDFRWTSSLSGRYEKVCIFFHKYNTLIVDEDKVWEHVRNPLELIFSTEELHEFMELW